MIQLPPSEILSMVLGGLFSPSDVGRDTQKILERIETRQEAAANPGYDPISLLGALAGLNSIMGAGTETTPTSPANTTTTPNTSSGPAPSSQPASAPPPAPTYTGPGGAFGSYGGGSSGGSVPNSVIEAMNNVQPIQPSQLTNFGSGSSGGGSTGGGGLGGGFGTYEPPVFDPLGVANGPIFTPGGFF